MLVESQLLIGAEKRTSGDQIEVFNPATQELVGKTPIASSSDIDSAIDFAHTAFSSWSKVPPASRAELIFKVAELIKGRKKELSRLITLEEGKTLKEAE